MRKIFVGALAPLLMVAMFPVSASAANRERLVAGYQEKLLGMTDTDQFLFDDGCVGGTSSHDPLFMVVPLTDPPSAQGACTARTGAPIFANAAGVTCWQPTAEAARDECEAVWADPAAVLVNASVTVDGRAQRLELTRVNGTFTFPPDAILDVGSDTFYYGISLGVELHGLNPGMHQVSISFEYADGFAGATTFSVTIENGHGRR
jgi:hypothetical protein